MNMPLTSALPAMNHKTIPLGPDLDAIRAAIRQASARIAPLWPLRHFVAVNPWVGMTELPFTAAATRMAQVNGARLTMPRQWYAENIDSGRITDADLAASLAAQHFSLEVKELKQAATAPASYPQMLPTVTTTAADHSGIDWDRLARERLSRWAAAYFDEGQTLWPSPWRSLPPFTAWREEALLDHTPELMGLRGFRAVVASLPDSAEDTVQLAVQQLGLDDGALEPYFHRLLMTIPGWAGYVRYQVWQRELDGKADASLTALLAIRLVWELAVHSLNRQQPAFVEAWASACTTLTAAPASSHDIMIDSLLHRAHEHAWQRRFAATLQGPRPAGSMKTISVQAAFCIDVRSEPLRRALETVAPNVQTLGFAGFFGMPVEYVPLGHDCGTAHCPVLLKPQHVVCETVTTADAAEHAQLQAGARARRLAQKGWQTFKSGAVSSFGYVEALGWTHAFALLRDALGLAMPAGTVPATAPSLLFGEHAGRSTGLPLAARIELAANLLRSLSLTNGFARLFVLTAHGATSTNNPHASSLDCGACGGHSGAVNARIAAAVLNDNDVRLALAERGIVVPADTVFVAALHDTTCDTLTVFDTDAVPASHTGELRQLQQWLQQAGDFVRQQRAQRLAALGAGSSGEDPRSRSRDWSQLLPELGLANCAAFIAAPRSRTLGLDLGGRAFLHDYNWHSDDSFRALEQIMTAPMVVASWISLQYFGSTVDNDHFGSGNKTLHNVVGALGVFEGNGGDLRAGLPLQSVKFGEQLLHEPLRLSVFIDAPTAAIDQVLHRQTPVRQLIDNHWLHLFAFASDDTALLHYVPGHGWQVFAADATHTTEEA